MRAATLDGLTAASPRVDLVKIDVEGAEDLVLDGDARRPVGASLPGA